MRFVTEAGAPSSVGPYSHAVTAGKFTFVSGQAGCDAVSGKVVGLDVESQTRQAIRNIRAILKESGAALTDVVRCGVYLADIRDFDRMNAIYAEEFGSHRPARTTIAVAGIPGLDRRVEIDAVALVGSR